MTLLQAQAQKARLFQSPGKIRGTISIVRWNYYNISQF